MKPIRESRITGIGPRSATACQFFNALIGAGLALAGFASLPAVETGERPDADAPGGRQ